MFQWIIDGKKVSDEEFLYRTSQFLPKEEWICLCNAIMRDLSMQSWVISKTKNLTLKDMEVKCL